MSANQPGPFTAALTDFTLTVPVVLGLDVKAWQVRIKVPVGLSDTSKCRRCRSAQRLDKGLLLDRDIHKRYVPFRFLLLFTL